MILLLDIVQSVDRYMYQTANTMTVGSHGMSVLCWLIAAFLILYALRGNRR